MRRTILGFFLFFTIFGKAQVNLNMGLVAYYPFNGNANDASGNNRNGTLVNGTTFGLDRFGAPNSSAKFDGVDDYVRIIDNGNAFYSPTLSIVLWFYSESANQQTIISKRDYTNSVGTGGHQYKMTINYNPIPGVISTLVGNNATCSNNPTPNFLNSQEFLCLNRWNCVIITFDGNRHKLYLNGILKNDQATPFNAFINCGSDIRIGNWWQLDPQSFKGQIDDIRWYNRVLTNDEITLLGENSTPCNQINCNNWLTTPATPSSMNIGDIDVGGDQLTVEALFNRTTPLNNNLYYGYLVSKHTNPTDANYALQPNGCEITTSISGNVKISQTCPIDLNKNYHVAMVYDGANLKFYRNGFLISQTPCTGTLTNNNLITTIGQMSGSTLLDNQFLGYINEVRIWNIARTQTEIRNYMNVSLPSPTTTTGLLAYYQFNSTLNKQGNPAYNGALNGSSQINSNNSKCEFSVDSCTIPSQCASANDFSFQRNACNPLQIKFITHASGFNSLKWDFGDGSFVVADTAPLHQYTNPGNYIVKLMQEFGSCNDTVTKTITLDLQNDNHLISTNDTTICRGSSKQIIGVGSFNFCWSPALYLDNPNISNPTTSTQQNITYYYTAETLGPNLVTNGNFNSGNTGFTSQYTYSNNNTLAGEYFVGPNPQAWNATLNTCSDHTSGNGNMLMVNGSATPNMVVWAQTINVTPNTNYSFSSWVQSLSNAASAQLFFSINGNPIGDSLLSSQPLCTWTAFHSNWNSGTATSAIISIINKGNLAQGSHFALDDISFAAIQLKTDSVRISVDSPWVRTNNDTTFCNGGQVQLNATGANTYSWSPVTGLNNPNIANPIATPATTTQYIVTGTTTNGCTAKDTVMININARPVVIMSADTTVCAGASVQLFATGGSSYSWTPAASLNNPNISNPVAIPVTTTTYYVTVTGLNSCTNNDSVKIDVRSPSLFSVNSPLNTCLFVPVQLSATGGDTYLWSPSQGLNNATTASPTATPTITTTYNVLITDTTCHIANTLTTTVTVLPTPNVQAQKANDINCLYDKSVLTASGALSYIWSPITGLSNPNIGTTEASPAATTQYIVKGKDANGCENSDSITLFVSNDGKSGYFIPNSFTPNGDGLNDCIGVKYWGSITDFEFSIFNRSGVRVYYSKNPTQCWDGTYLGSPQPPSVFVYYIKAKSNCDNQIFRKGIITLIK